MPIVGPSFGDLVAVGQAELQLRRPEVIVYEGSLVQADLHSSAAMADSNERMSALRFRNTFLDGARGDDLTVLVNDRYNLQRQEATSAVVSVNFARLTTLTAGSIPAGTQIGTDFSPDGSRVTYTTNAAISVAIGQAGPFSVFATATASGVTGNAAPGKVTKVIDALFDTFSVTNLAAAAGGNAEEDDDSLRARARSYFQTLRRGTLASLEFGALTVPLVRIAKATEDQLTGLVSLAVSDETGSSNAQMVSEVEAIIDLWRCAGVIVNIIGGVALFVDIAVGVRARPGFDVAAIAIDLAEAITARINRLKVGDTLYIDMVTSTLLGQYPDELLDAVYSSVVTGGVPAASPDDLKNITPPAGSVIRAGTITVVAI